MAERGLGVDHSTIGRWVLRYAPELNKRIRRDTRTPNRSWRADETYVRVAGAWTYLYRAVDSRMVKKLDLLESNHGCELNALFREKHSKPNVTQRYTVQI